MSAADVVVVGGGPAGLLVAETLRAAGLDAVLLEAGPAGEPGGFAPPSDPTRWAWRAPRGRTVAWSRTHALGGRTIGWGGLAFRFPPSVFEDWPYDARTLAPDYAAAEAWLGVVEGGLRAGHRRAAAGLGWGVRALRGARRGGIVWTARHAAGAAQARTGTTALRVEGEGRGAAVLAATPRGIERIAARGVVLAAGPVETARLLLASGFGRALPAIGEGLVDHPTLGFALFERRPAPAPLRPEPLLEGALFEVAADGVTIEVVGPRPLAEDEAGTPAALGWADVAPEAARVTAINALGRTQAHPGRRVSLARDARDDLGRPLPVLHLGARAADRARFARMRAACLALADRLAAPGSVLVPTGVGPPGRHLFHEAGTCAMGGDGAPCDAHGRLRAGPPLWIADASVFPSAGDRHPTLTVLAHALRAARDVARTLS